MSKGRYQVVPYPVTSSKGEVRRFIILDPTESPLRLGLEPVIYEYKYQAQRIVDLLNTAYAL